MPSIHRQIAIDVAADKACTALRDVGQAHTLFAPVLTDGQLADDVRTVRFANGMVVKERILDVNDETRRLSYAVVDGGMTYHHASMRIVDQGAGRCLFVWITDFLPPEMAANLTPLIEQGAKALKANLERA